MIDQKEKHGRIFVAGPGALGLFLAAHFSRAGHPTVLIPRPETPPSALNPLIVSRDGAPLPCSDAHLPLIPPENLPADAWRGSTLVITVKAFDVPPLLARLAESFRDMESAPRAVLLLSNGLGITELLRSWKRSLFPGSRVAIARGTAWFGCLRESKQRVRFAGPARLDWAWIDEDRSESLSETLKHALSTCRITPVQEDSAKRLEWRKGAWNASMNALLALADAPNGVLLEPGVLAGEFETLLNEARKVAQSDGAALDSDDISLIRESIERTRSNWNSLHGDLRSGRPTEVPFLNEWLVARARALGVPVPAHERLIEAVGRFQHEREERLRRESASN